VIERKYYQRQLGEGFIHDNIDGCWEPWMKIADEILDDEELIEAVYEALRRRRPQSGLLSIMLCLRTVYRLPSNRAWNIALSCGSTEWMR